MYCTVSATMLIKRLFSPLGRGWWMGGGGGGGGGAGIEDVELIKLWFRDKR